MRVFIAIEFDRQLKRYLWERQQVIRQNSIKGNFSHEENFHLTLRFIGEVQSSAIGALKEAITETAAKHQHFELALKGLGQFPRGGKSIIWVGMEKSTSLEKMFTDMENALESRGYPREGKGLTPHITLGREVTLRGDFDELRRLAAVQPVKIPVTGISLMESTRIEGKLTYVPIYRMQLG